jgi:PAS domain S-box-containing protein/putative nucleotidyltransferase with HDIG domain
MEGNNKRPNLEIPEKIKKLQEEVIEKGLNNSEERFKIFCDYAPDGYYITDLRGNFIDGNKTAERITGYSRLELIGKNYYKTGLLSLNGLTKAISGLKKNRRGLIAEPQEYTLKRKDGKLIEVEISSCPVRINNQMYSLGIARNISKRKYLEKAVEQVEKEREIILDISPLHILYQDINHNIIWANKAVCDSVGKYLSELKGKRCYQVLTGINKTCTGCPVERSWDSRQLAKGEITTSDNRHWLVTGRPFINEQQEITGAIESIMDITNLKRSQQKLEKSINVTIDIIFRIIDARDPHIANHQSMVSKLATQIAREMKLPKHLIETITMASLLHDIGKIGLPSEILTKPSKLNDSELSLIKTHSQMGYKILKDIDFPYPIAPIILQHHERINGSGYPQGLKGKDILLEARIIMVADVVEAMSSHRPYRPALGIDVALDEIIKNSGILYDPKVVDACVKLFREKAFQFQ